MPESSSTKDKLLFLAVGLIIAMMGWFLQDIHETQKDLVQDMAVVKRWVELQAGGTPYKPEE